MKQKQVERQAKIITARTCFYDLGSDDTAALRRYSAVMRTRMDNNDAPWHQLLWAPLEDYSTDDVQHVMEYLYRDIITRFTETP